MLFNKPLDSLNPEDLQILIDNQVFESKTVEYKKELNLQSEKGKKGFLAAASAFANAAGGFIFFGIEEKNGYPIKIVGITTDNPDATKLDMENLLASSIDPRIPGLQIELITLSNNNHVYVLYILQSWAAPHMITFQEWNRFYSRNSAGKYILDVSEIKAAFLLSESASREIRNFRIERISKFVSQQTPLPMEPGPKVLVNIVPFSAFSMLSAYDVFSAAKCINHCRPLANPPKSGWQGRPNFDGYIFADFTKEYQTADLQIFRNGCIESVDSNFFKLIKDDFGNESLILNPKPINSYLNNALKGYLTIESTLGVLGPFFVMISILDIANCKLPSKYQGIIEFSQPLNLKEMILPELLIQDDSVDISEIMQSTYSIIWNAFGFLKEPEL